MPGKLSDEMIRSGHVEFMSAALALEDELVDAKEQVRRLEYENGKLFRTVARQDGMIAGLRAGLSNAEKAA